MVCVAANACARAIDGKKHIFTRTHTHAHMSRAFVAKTISYSRRCPGAAAAATLFILIPARYPRSCDNVDVVRVVDVVLLLVGFLVFMYFFAALGARARCVDMDICVWACGCSGTAE